MLFNQLSFLKLSKYTLVGIISVIVDYLFLYLAFSVIALNAQPSIAIAFFISAIFNYTMNRKFTFNSKGKRLNEAIKYLLLVFIMYLLTIFIISWLVSQGIDIYFAKLLSTFAVFLISFMINQCLVYV